MFIKPLAVIAIMCLAMPLFGCATVKPDAHLTQTPKFDIKTYFDGPIKAYGIVQDRSGTVINRFDVDMVGTWNGDEGQLSEVFHYYDGAQGQPLTRTWYFTKNPDGSYAGRATDITTAQGKIYGSAGQWRYGIDLLVGKSVIHVNFEDWMWQMRDGVVINRSYIRKFGVTVATVTIVMQKK